MKKIVKDKENCIIDKYKDGYSCRDIGKLFNISETTVFNILKRNNIETRTKGGIYKLPEEEIILLYLNNNTLEQISNIYSVSIETIRIILIKNNIHIRTRNEIFNPNLNENFFEIIDCEEKAYYLGLILADGCIVNPSPNNNRPNYSLCIELKQEDEYILKQFANIIGCNDNFYYNRNCCRLSITSNKLINDLFKYTVIPNKTWTAFVPIINNYFMPDLIRGLIDGDGWITRKIDNRTYKYIYTIGFCGNKTMVTCVRDYLVNTLSVHKVKVLDRNTSEKGTFSQIVWSSVYDVFKICSFIYRNGTCRILLIRKYNKFLQFYSDKIIPR